MHVTEQMQGKSVWRLVDLRVQDYLGLFGQPVRRVMGHQHTQALPSPRHSVPSACLMKLPDMERQLFFERTWHKLQEGAVEADDAELDDAELDVFLLDSRRKIPGKDPL